MGWSLQVLVLVLLVLVCPSRPSICEYNQCNCTIIANKWINAVCAFNSTQKQLDITPETLPRHLAELEISGPREMVLSNGSFSRNLTGLSLVRLADIGTLTVERKAFARIAHPHLRLQVSGAQRVILESNAFFELKSSVVSARLERVDHVIVQEYAFDRLLSLEVRQVGHLELKPNAFYYSPDSRETQGPATRITLDRVKVKELPYNVFPALNQLSILNSAIVVVKSSSLRAIIMTTVRIVNTTLSHVETEAFTRSQIGLLELDGGVVGQLQPNCVQSGISHLVIRGSSFRDVAESAFNTAAATVTLSGNVFDRVRSRGFTLKENSALTVEHNRFNILEDSAFVLPEGESTGQMFNITFRENSVGNDIGKGTLDFTRSRDVGTNVNNNNFDYPCQCEGNMKSWLKEKINGSDSVIISFYKTSLCQINLDLARCFSIPHGVFMMENFSSLACGDEEQYYCPEVIQSDAAVPSFPGMTSDVVYEISNDRERKVIGSIFIFVISGIIVMLFLSGFMWLRRKGYCTKARLLLLPSGDSMLNIISRVFVGSSSTTGTASTARVQDHEYTELQQAQKQAEESVEEEVSLDDKATQTLPEELTQELLQSLREKLDDPDNYSEARDMIEHLYDLIKVEESCNQNFDFTSIQLEDEVNESENVYDVIQPKTKTKNRVPREKKSLVSVGTRAPSPDKLLPLSLTKRKPAVICDYTEPRDRQMHVYQELQGTQPSASVLCDYMEPPDVKPHVYLELPVTMVNRPLPSKPDQRLSDPGEGPSTQQPTVI